MKCNAGFRAVGVAGLFALSLAACSPPAADPELVLTAKPRTIDNRGGKSLISVTATDSAGKPGAGTVRLTSPAGAFAAGTEVTLLNGAIDAEYSCNVATDSTCTGGAQRIKGEWLEKGKLVEATVTVTVTAVAGDAGVDGGADAGLDAGLDAGFDAGLPDAGRDAGGGDGGLTLTSDRPRIFMSVGDQATLRATLAPPVAGQQVTFATTLGLLSDFDAGMQDLTFQAMTDSTGVALARFTENGSAGTATITATSGTYQATASVDILAVQNIQYVSTQCGTAACTVMGARGSGFNESAQVKFKVVDSLNRGVGGVRVTFSIANPPAGTTVSPESRTDQSGEVVANVAAGTSAGAFNVHATVIAGMVETDSPTIGLRGAKPSNNGFSLQCAAANLPAYIEPIPPRRLTVNCIVTLVDRYGNPVGRSTPVRLNSEAGTVPASINTTAYSPTGTNADEGKATFAFSTAGPFPALDVPPLPANSNQYPIALQAEPSRSVGALVLNPRDGLVTIIAYVRGEEHFWDDNSNGVYDVGERFIDQGEPFIDSNDNNVWDPGEPPPIDESPTDGAWTPPNGRWDSNVTIWTATYVLYTGATDPGAAYLSPSTFNVGKGASTLLAAYLGDSRLNRVESGAAVSATQTAMKGSVTVANSIAGLDGFGFGFEPRYLVSGSGSGPCDATQTVCTFRTLFTTWGSGFIADVRIVGASPTDMTAPQASTVTATATTKGVSGSTSASGTIQ